MKIEGDMIYFSSGRKVYANCGIIGLSPELHVSEGYDGGGLCWPQENWGQDDPLTAEDMRELADHMIAKWEAFRGTLP